MTKFNPDLITKARKGEIAILNDGSVEELREVLKGIWPKENTSPSITAMACRYFMRYPFDEDRWCAETTSSVPGHSVKHFFMPDTKEHNHRAFKLKQRLPDLPAGSIFVSIKQGSFYQCEGTRYKAPDVELDTEFFEEISVCKECGKPINPPK